MNTFKLRTEKNPEYKLTVDTGDDGAEIFMINSQFQRIDRKCGRIAEFLLPSGLYMIRVRTGSRYAERDVDLFADRTEVFTPVAFPTSAPLEGTGKTHEWQIASAQEESIKIHKTLGMGSQIYVYCRDWTSKSDLSLGTSTRLHPATGLTLRDRAGNVLVDFSDPSFPCSQGEDPWSACNVEVNAGIYYLRLETGSDEILEMSVVACYDWQIQVFMLQRDYGTGLNDRRADLASASIFMERRGKGFYSKKKEYVPPDDVNFRLTEIARQALKNDRKIISPKIIDDMLDDKSINPMLGIYGAHLILMEPAPDVELLRTVIQNLRRYVGIDHPDVEALALKIGYESNYVYDMPPMLRRSWNYMLEASVKKPELVPENSMVSQIYGLLWSEDPWLIWGSLKREFNKSEKLMQQVKKYLAYEPETGSTINLDVDIPETRSLESLESSIPKKFKSFSDLTDKDKQQLVQATQVPLSKLNSMIKNFDQDTQSSSIQY